MTEDLTRNILNLKPSIAPTPRNEPYKLTFYVENDSRPLQMTDLNSNYYDDVVVESFEGPTLDGDVSNMRARRHDSYCVLSAFLYFVTITTFAYLFILWIREKVHVQMELLHWW